MVRPTRPRIIPRRRAKRLHTSPPTPRPTKTPPPHNNPTTLHCSMLTLTHRHTNPTIHPKPPTTTPRPNHPILRILTQNMPRGRRHSRHIPTFRTHHGMGHRSSPRRGTIRRTKHTRRTNPHPPDLQQTRPTQPTLHRKITHRNTPFPRQKTDAVHKARVRFTPPTIKNNPPPTKN